MIIGPYINALAIISGAVIGAVLGDTFQSVYALI